MQTTLLRTLLAIQETGSFSSAATIVHLSHSAVSIQMKQLEQHLGAALFIKGRRPAILTPLGEEIADKAREIVTQLDNLKSLANTDDLGGKVTLGFVPTTLQTLLPVALGILREEFPEMQVCVRSDLSNQLAKMIESRDIDFAFLSAPVSENDMIRLYEIGAEPLFLVTAKHNTSLTRQADILRQNPYIAFNRNTWLGQQIASHLTQRGLSVEPAIELDSIDAIEHLVARDFGVSIVPQRLLAAPLEQFLRCLPLGTPAPVRRVMLATQRHCHRQTLLHRLTGIADSNLHTQK